MWRLTLVMCALAALAASPGCTRKRRPQAAATEEEASALASVVQVADQSTASQLVKGFHGVEQNAWRWTERRFTVALHPPRGSAQAGAMLKLNFSAPDPVIARVGKLTLTARIAGIPLAPETIDRPGEHVYAREVPPAALASDVVTVEFALDKFLPAGAVDQRELGIVVTQIGLETK